MIDYRYDPANSYTKVNGCYQQQALARLWFEGLDEEYSWPADANQIISVPEASATLKKRQGETCLLTSPTATASSVEVTSTTPLPTQSMICLTSSLAGCSYAYQYVEAAFCTTTAPSLPARCTAAPSTTTPDTSSSLPTLPAQCATSSLVNCQWIYQNVDKADCPTTTSLLPASCTNIPPATTGDSGSPGPEPTAALYIELLISTVPGRTTPWWLVFTPPVNAGPPGPPSFDPCGDRVTQIGIASLEGIDISKHPTPDGTIPFFFKILGTSGCSYTGTWDAAGTLNCPVLTKPVQCVKDSSYTQITCVNAVETNVIYTSVYCAWG